MTAWFPDVSKYQGTVDWAKIKAAGAVGGVCKATQGTSGLDGYLPSNRVRMRSAGIGVRGFYHFGDILADPVAQARWFVSKVGALQPGEFLVLDIERGSTGLMSKNRAWVQSFVDEVHRLTGRWSLIYTGPYYWTSTFGSWKPANCLLWVAHYTSASSPTMPAGWTAAALWQYTSSAIIPGISTRADNSRALGSLAPLLQPAPVPKPPAPNPVAPFQEDSVLIISHVGHPEIYLFMGGKLIHIVNPSVYHSIPPGSIPTIAADDEQFALFVKTFGPPVS